MILRVLALTPSKNIKINRLVLHLRPFELPWPCIWRLYTKIFLTPALSLKKSLHTYKKFELDCYICISLSFVTNAIGSFRMMWVEHISFGSSLKVEKLLKIQIQGGKELRLNESY
jgi:hypothetical protein